MKLWLIFKEMFINGTLQYLNISSCDDLPTMILKYKKMYELNTHKLDDDIIILYDALCCRNSNCNLHNNDIDGFYNAILSVLHKSTQNCIPTSVL